MGSGTYAHEDLAAPLGRVLAGLPVHLLTGGGRGVMASVSKAFVETYPRRGLSLGVLPSDDEMALPTPPVGYPNPFVEIPIRTHLPRKAPPDAPLHTRNVINVLTADIIVFLPGSEGTRDELSHARLWGTPCILYLRDPQDLNLPAGTPICRRLDQVEAALMDHFNL
jgi:predicted Rossmann-fold nucleotide-binding protein